MKIGDVKTISYLKMQMKFGPIFYAPLRLRYTSVEELSSEFYRLIDWRKNRRSKSYPLRGGNNFLSVLSKCNARFWQNLVQKINKHTYITSSVYEFHENRQREGRLAWKKLHLGAFRETVWYFESKGRLTHVHGVPHLQTSYFLKKKKNLKTGDRRYTRPR